MFVFRWIAFRLGLVSVVLVTVVVVTSLLLIRDQGDKQKLSLKCYISLVRQNL